MECPNDRYAMVRYYQRTDVCPNCGHSVSETIDWPPVNTTLLILKNQRAMMEESKCKWNCVGVKHRRFERYCKKHQQFLAGGTCDSCPDYEPVSPESVDIVDRNAEKHEHA